MKTSSEDIQFDELQLEQIKKGQEEGLDISKYADPRFDDSEMWLIREGLEKGLDVSWYADPKFGGCTDGGYPARS